MAITAQLVKELREITGAGMMDCKKALTAVEGDMEKAIDFLREKGLAGAQKKAGRIAAEGIVDTKLDDDAQKGVIVEVNAETDFVAKNEKFINYVREIADQALDSGASSLDEFLAEKWALDDTLTVQEKLSSMISIIGENMKIRRYEIVEAAEGFVQTYIHAGGKIGVLLEVASDQINDDIIQMAKNICMQIAALKPLYISQADVDQEYLDKEKEILRAQIMNDPKESQKPEKVIEGILNGRIKKEMKEICLLDQTYVKAEDGKQSVKDYIAQVAKANGANISIRKFVRYETGEGLEKRNDNFAEEVAKQMGM